MSQLAGVDIVKKKKRKMFCSSVFSLTKPQTKLSDHNLNVIVIIM